MKNFLWKAGFCALLALVANLGTHWFYAYCVLPKSIPERTRQQFLAAPEEHRVLFVGDSHVKNGVDPRPIPGAFNFAVEGETYLQGYYKVRTILAEDDSLKTIVLPVDPHSFGSFRKLRILNPLFWSHYVDFIEVAQETGEYSLISKWVQSRFASHLGSGTGFVRGVGVLLLKREHELIQGYRPYKTSFADLSPEERSARARARVEMHFSSETHLDELLLSYFERTIALCREHGVEVKLVSYPLTDEFVREMEPHFPEAEFQARVAAILDEHPTGVEWLEYRNVFSGRPELFKDVDHLNERGAKLFSEMLRDQLD